MSYLINSFSVAPSGGVSGFGALVTLASDLTSQDYSAGAAVPFDTTVYEYGDWVSGSALVVPTGVTRVRLSAQIGITNQDSSLRTLEIYKNGSSLSPPVVGNEDLGVAGPARSQLHTYILDVSVGNSFTLFFDSGTDTSMTIVASETWLSIEMVE
jgi:hypothetical protein